MIFIRKNSNNEKNDFWIGFSDLMTGLMLVFIVLSLVFMATANKDKNRANFLLIQAKADKKKMEHLISQAKADKEELDKRRKNIIMIMSKELQKHNIKFEYDSKKGTVTIAQDILFTQRKATLNIKGKNFIQIFANILDKNIFNNREYQDLVKYVHIEGYASREGTVEYNFALSFQRAKNVWVYMTNGKLSHKKIMKKKLNIVSRGEIESNQEYSDKKDRKVVFRFEFYDTYDKIFKGLSQ